MLKKNHKRGGGFLNYLYWARFHPDAFEIVITD